MQTWLPYPNFRQSMRCLDQKRLTDQKIGAWNILGVLKYPEAMKPWRYHPAVVMWWGYEPALKLYIRACLDECIRRELENFIPIPLIDGDLIEMPWWLGDERLHSSHRANLLRKDYAHYSRFHWQDEPTNVYFWPNPVNRTNRFIAARRITL